jgi:hypothetical protein
MFIAIRFAALLCVFSAVSFAGTWTGTLVDSRCYASEERNVNPTDTLTYVDRDGNREVRYCSPRAKTKSFAVVQADGTIVSLDSAGNAKAAELVRAAGKQSRFAVGVTGTLSKDTISVDSITMAK